MAQQHIQALNLSQNGDWNGAHQLIQNAHDKLARQIHGYLHRQQGDINNASYWYSQIGLEIPSNSLEQEFLQLMQYAQKEESINN